MIKYVNGVAVEMTPLEIEIKQAEEATRLELKAGQYQNLRRIEYPDIGDQLDAILKYFMTIKRLPPDLQNIIDQWQAVKLKYPKTLQDKGNG